MFGRRNMHILELGQIVTLDPAIMLTTLQVTCSFYPKKVV